MKVNTSNINVNVSQVYRMSIYDVSYLYRSQWGRKKFFTSIYVHVEQTFAIERDIA
jgi:hypothetical protein